MKLLFPLFSLAILLSACSLFPDKNAGPQPIALIGPNKEIVEIIVEVADETGEIQKVVQRDPEKIAAYDYLIDQIANLEAIKKDERKAKLDEIRGLGKNDLKTLPEIKDALFKVMEILNLR